jgi:hypothetical protein
MKAPLFEYPTYQYQIKDWEFKKKGLLKRIKEEKFVRTDLQTFETDRQTNKKSYLHYFQDLIKDELWEFVQEAQVTCSMTDCWTVRYQKGDHQTIHNHKSWGFTGILYVDFDPKVHTPTCFVAPWQDPRSDTTSLAYPPFDPLVPPPEPPCRPDPPPPPPATANRVLSELITIPDPAPPAPPYRIGL